MNKASNTVFRFKHFSVEQRDAAMKVGTDGVLLGAWVSLGVGVDGGGECGSDGSGGKGTSLRVLDVGTGTGLIALMIAQRCPEAVIDAVEIDPASAAQARRNVEASPWTERIRVHNSSIQEFRASVPPISSSTPSPVCVSLHASPNGAIYSPVGGGFYDIVVSNPPYFVDSLLPPDGGRALARHTSALTYGELATHAARLLREGGRLAVILPADSGEKFVAEAPGAGFELVRRMSVYPRLGGAMKRVMMEFRKCGAAACGSVDKFGVAEPYSISEQTLAIEDAAGYTAEYRALTAEFYLKF